MLHKLVKRAIVIVGVIATLVMSIPFMSAQTNTSFDVVFVIDNSGSMLKSDPEHLALKGAELFTDLLSGTNSRAGYVMFSDTIRDKRPLDIVTGNDKLRDAFENTVYPEVGATDIGYALNEAYNLFVDDEKFKDNKKIVIFLSDGKPEVSGKTDEELYESIDEAVNQFAADGIPVYSIALNGSAEMDIPNMKSISKTTDGLFFEVTQNTDLPKCFMNIFVNLSSGKISEFANDGKSQLLINDNTAEVFVVGIPACKFETDMDFTVTENKNYVIYKKSNPVAGNYQLKNITETAVPLDITILTVEKTAETCTVTFDTDGGTEISPMYVAKGSLLPHPTLSKTGFNLKYWEFSGEKFDFNTPVTSDITLKAVWEKNVAVTDTEKQDVKPVIPAKEKEANLVVVAIFSFITLAVIIFGIFIYPKVFVDKIFGIHPLLSSLTALAVNVFICVTVWIWFKEIFEIKFDKLTPEKQFYGKSFNEVYEKYFFITGVLAAFLYNLVFGYLLPALTSNLLKVKKMQCRVFTLISLVGIVFPLYFWYVCAFSFGTFLLFLILYIFTFVVNFVLCSICIRFTYGKYFRFIA
ncbi:MAG: VWA domain-containing protein [Oscillospiraceae bacterium]|nr:VWA domain-containing protein [Oscillospiraceae bacterium]